MNEILTKQDKKFVKEITETGNKTQSAKIAYGYKDDNVAGVMANKRLKKVKIQEAIKSIADSIPDSLVAEKHLALLNKEEVRMKNNMTTGEIDVIPTGEIDAQAVAKGLDMAYKLKGSYAPDKNININMNVKTIDPTNPKVLELIEELRKANETQ